MYNIFGDYMNRLKDMREDMDLSQKDLADLLNCCQTTYSRYENQNLNVPVDALVTLALHYDTSVDYLIGLTDIKKPYKRSKKYSSKK